MGWSSEDFAGALLIIFKTNSSVTGSQYCEGFPAKGVSGQADGCGEAQYDRIAASSVKQRVESGLAETE